MTCITQKLTVLLVASLAITALAQAAPDLSDDGFAAQAAAMAKPYLSQLGSDYHVRVDSVRRLVYISALDDQHFNRTTKRLAAFADAFRGTLGASVPTRAITIVLPTADDYRQFAPASVLGFYQPASRTLVALDRGRVLLHEFTHALHHAAYDAAGQQHPIWIIEGLAKLFEAGRIVAHKFEPRTEISLLTLQKAISTKKAIPLGDLIKLDKPNFYRNAQLTYPQARYLMLYLHRKGLLAKWYANYLATFEQDPTGKRALEKTLRRKLFQIERDWRKWAGELKIPFGETTARRARLGMQMKDTPSGIKVAGLLPGSAAARAKRIKVGDKILKFNGREVKKAIEVIALIHRLGAMQTVTIELQRNNRRITIRQPLGQPGTLNVQ